MPGWIVRTHADLPSTQDAMRAAIAAGAGEGAVIQAIRQSAGRGRRGNQWVSPPGNLYMSVLLKPDCMPERAGQLAFIVAIAVMKAIDTLAPDMARDVTLKWPNDVLIGGRKCAGILLDSDIGPVGVIETLIAGIGVNVAAPPPDCAGLGTVAVDDVRDAVLFHLAESYERWKAEGFAWARDEWMARAHGLGQPVTARLHDRDMAGVFQGIDSGGALILRLGDGTDAVIHAGAVHFPE